jgi:hypothetical protein
MFKGTTTLKTTAVQDVATIENTHKAFQKVIAPKPNKGDINIITALIPAAIAKNPIGIKKLNLFMISTFLNYFFNLSLVETRHISTSLNDHAPSLHTLTNEMGKYFIEFHFF